VTRKKSDDLVLNQSGKIKKLREKKPGGVGKADAEL